MKLMKKSDLILVLSEIETDRPITISDLMCLYEGFGDEYTVRDNKLVPRSENAAMKALRNEKESNRDYRKICET